MVNREKITTIDFEHSLNEEVRLKIENHREGIEELENKKVQIARNRRKSWRKKGKIEIVNLYKTIYNINNAIIIVGA